MTAPTRKYQWDETLLYQGKYRQWFWASLSAEAHSYVIRKQCPDCYRTPSQANKTCECYAQRWKPSEWVNREGLAWRLQAACKGADLETFFPKNEAVFNGRSAPWREYCPCCKVSGLCTLFAADSHSIGVYGGRLFGAKSTFKSSNPTGSGQRGRPRKNRSTSDDPVRTEAHLT